jgi:hypothetical protein
VLVGKQVLNDCESFVRGGTESVQEITLIEQQGHVRGESRHFLAFQRRPIRDARARRSIEPLRRLIQNVAIAFSGYPVPPTIG